MIALRALEDIATLSETVDIEYKLAAGELPADFWATYSAFCQYPQRRCPTRGQREAGAILFTWHRRATENYH